MPTDSATVFSNHYTPEGRRQILSERAEDITPSHIPTEWRASPIIHLAPVAQEFQPEIAHLFPDSIIALTPQGWMRRWNANGLVYPVRWAEANRAWPATWIVVMSSEDLQHDENTMLEYAKLFEIVLVTRGELGCTLFHKGQQTNIPASKVSVADTTGAGDIFASAFIVEFYRTGNPDRSARFATQLASFSVSRTGLDSVPGKEDIEKAQAAV